MTSEEREARLTAYALNDPGLSAAERQEIESHLAGDPASLRAVEETRRLARLLSAGLAAEQAAAPAGTGITLPAMQERPSRRPRWAGPAVAAAAVLVAVGGSIVGWAKWNAHRQDRDTLAQVALHEREVAPGVSDRRSRPVGASTGRWLAEGGAAGAAVDFDQSMALPGEPTVPAPRARGDTDQSAKPGPSPDALETAKRDRASTAGSGDLPQPGLPGRSSKSGKDKASEIPPPLVTAPRPGGLPPAPGLPAPTSKPTVTAAIAPQPSPGVPADPFSRAEANDQAPRDPTATDRHLALAENGFTRVEGINALSTFGVDVDTASYAIVRKYLTLGQLPPPNAVRLEEMVNYFPYTDKPPTGDDPFAVTVEMAECPWQPAHRLVRLGLKAKPIASDRRPASNLVFLVDVSGSMNADNKLPLVKASLKLLVNQLGEKDRIAIVVYAGASGLVLESTPATQKDKIIDALDRLSAGGSTNGSGGIQQAYEVAVANFIKGGTNRVIVCTDGDWNVGTTSTDALVKLIEQKRETGVFLSVFGFGMGNLRDEMMVQLAGKGNGNYGYIDTLKEANKAFVEQMGGTLVTVAKDVKIQVEFNPAVIKAYRLLGYEKRALAAQDFHDDRKDAGEMGAGHVVTALYELVPAGAPDPVAGQVDGLRYQPEPAPKAPAPAVKADEAFVVKMRHKKPDSDTSTLRELPVKDSMVGYEKASEDFQFAAAVASFAMLLRDSAYKGHANYGLVLELAASAMSHDPGGYRAEFVDLVKKAKHLAGK